MPESASTVTTGWLRPDGTDGGEPRWGFPDGLQVGLKPEHGPRGLLRVYAPFLGHADDRLLNFIAIEPIPRGQDARGYSELEESQLAEGRGKVLWSADVASALSAGPTGTAARGVTSSDDGVERLEVFIGVERFLNGADVYLRLRFRADRPREVGVATFAHDGSVPLAFCVVSATMGNYARLRRLQLADRVVTTAELFPGFEGEQFTGHGTFGLGDFTRGVDGSAEVSATTDEDAPGAAVYSDDTADHWKYSGALAVQSWRVDEPDPALVVSVNARRNYWASASPIPGGASFENFELIEPFRQGAEFTFGVREA